ncbi:Major facilitator superfamily domain, general substrate transporter [Niveomyces insectorum RCEF 264]|uniref:Major facilitator superfamily domain, general substrate transporter n=1 Tax=Niveomyces insectorum RCEF 264 TaxID=1081102 RepID=A0A162MQK3_9HYPO|nr:Major facilitator superfamily domain, general substrate transporter [Niveomyces insectorum RCEF 264]
MASTASRPIGPPVAAAPLSDVELVVVDELVGADGELLCDPPTELAPDAEAEPVGEEAVVTAVELDPREAVGAAPLAVARWLEVAAEHHIRAAGLDHAGSRVIDDSNAPADECEPHGKSHELNEVRLPEELDSSAKTIPEDSQAGVRAVEAAAVVWTRWHMVGAYTIIWFIYFITSTQEVVVRVLSPFVTSAFALHSLTAATTIIASVVGGLSKLPLAKILDTWGRPQGLALMLLIWVLGFVMMAACKNVETYAAAQVFSSVGSQGVSYCLTIFIADTSSLKNRSLMLAFATSPYIVTPWIGGPMADSIYAGPGWRWGFGIFAIITPVVVLPLCVLFLWNQWKARKLGVLPPRRTKITFRSVVNYAIEVDLLGILILAGGMALFLLPFSLYSYQAEKWRAPMIICMMIFGGLLIIVFVVYEKFFAPVTFIPVSLLADRTVFFAGLMLVFVFFNSTVWGSYFTSMLLVVWNQSVTQTTYISNIYRVGSCFSALIIGYFIRLTGHFKWVALYFALPLMILGVGLMVHFRQPESSVGYIIMTQIFVAFAGGPIVIAAEMAMMVPSKHQHIAAIMAILDLFGSVGSALGSTVSAAIWTGVFHDSLKKYLPPDAPIENIYGSLYTQLAYKKGTPIRMAISQAYGDAQKYMLITSVCLLGAALVCAAFWRDINIKNLKQVRGLVV